MSMLATHYVVDKEHRELGGALAAWGGGISWARSGVGVSYGLAAALATWEKIDAAVRGQQPPHQPPDLPQCQVSNLKVPKNHDEAMESDYHHLRSDSMRREIHGLECRGICPVTQQVVDNVIDST